MSTLAPVSTPQGEKREYRFEPPYSRKDFEWMSAILTDATLAGIAATRFIRDDSITVTTFGSTPTSAELRVQTEQAQWQMR